MRTFLIAFLAATPTAALPVQKAKVAPPRAPSELQAIPDYGSTTIELAWMDKSGNETSFEVFRSEDGGAFSHILSTIPNTTSTTDTAVGNAKEYRYRVRARNGAAASGFSNTARQNLKTVWPVPASHELLTGWNDTLGDDAVDETGEETGFHMGVDVQRVGNANAVLATRGGVVSNVEDGPDGVVVITVKKGATFEYFQTNHTDNPTVALNEVVRAGQQVAEIDETHFPVGFTDHTHYVITNAAYAALQLHPLSIFSANADKDPKQEKPEFFDHTTDGEAGIVLYQAPGAAAGDYLTVDDTHPLEGDADVIVDLRDEQGTLPDQLPTRLSYWIDGPTTFCILPNHDVKDETSPYVLYSWANAYFGDAPAPKALSQKIVDYAQNAGPHIMDGGNYPWENYKNFIVTNTKGTDGTHGNVDATQYWNTNAEDDGAADTSDHANYAGLPDTTKAIEARFQDGDYTIHVLASDLIHADEDLTHVVRLENFCPIVCDVRPAPGEFLPPFTPALPFAHFVFNEPMDPTIDPTLIASIDNGAALVNVMWLTDRILQFDIIGLMSGVTYTLKAEGSIAKDRPGTPGHRMLDGDQDGTCGDDFTSTFSVASP